MRNAFDIDLAADRAEDGVRIGPPVDSALVARTRAGEMPVSLSVGATAINHVAVAPVATDKSWTGAAGLVSPIDARAAEALSGLTRSAVVVVASNGATVTTLDTMSTRLIVAESKAGRLASTPMVIRGGPRRLVAVSAPLDRIGSVVFARYLDDELAVLPQLRRVAAISAIEVNRRPLWAADWTVGAPHEFARDQWEGGRANEACERTGSPTARAHRPGYRCR